jgi:dihydroorotate dehydrogenase (NAD+) catalytic subunit
MSKRDFTLDKPLMNAAGALGFAPDERLPAPWEDFGAFVTNPLSLRPRRPAVRPAVVDFPGGFLLHSGLPNPGLDAVLRKYAARWGRSRLPVVVHLMADRPEETAAMVRRLEGLDGVMAAELGFAPQLADELILLAADMSLGELPLIASLPFEQVLRLGPRLIDMGVQAVSLAAPRGLLRLPAAGTSAHGIELVTGRLLGPALFAQSLLIVRDAVRARLPVIAGCGVYSQSEIEAMLQVGALAVQLDSTLWRGDFDSK